MLVLTAVGAIAALTLILATLLVLADKGLHVEEDPRIGNVETLLPGTNCGACGYPGCRALAEALVGGDALPGLCTVSTPAGHARIAELLHVEVGQGVKRVARLACAGGTNVARNRAHYSGLKSCGAAAQVAGGGKGCAWGCLGLGDCESSCDFDAIHMNAHALPVVDEATCTACGDCVAACPKDLFSLHPVTDQLWVACKNLEAGDDVLAECAVACTACGRCAMDARGDLVTMQNNLPVVDYARPGATAMPIERCPTGAIVWIERDGKVVKGAAAVKVIRKGALHASTT